MYTGPLRITQRRGARLLVPLFSALALLWLGSPAAAQTGASDNFNRPDGSLGPNWAKPIASDHDLVIVGNQVGVTVENSYNYAFWTANSFGDDQYSQITITRMGSWPGVILRADSVLDRFYLGLLVGPNDYRIYARWDGGYYLLAGGTAATWQVGDTFRMEIKGSTNPMTVTLYQNGNPVLAWTSTVPAQVRTGGSPGIGIYSPSGLGLTLDNWAGGSLAPDTQAPTVPGNVTATAVNGSQISLSWTASTDNVGVTGYLVERQNPGSGSFAQVGTVTVTAFNDTGLAAGTSYSYRVRATDAAGNLSGYSSVASATTLAPDTQPPTAPASLTATAVSGSQISLSWSGSTDNVGVTAYLVERQDPGSATFAQIGTATGTAYNDTGLAGSSTYTYRVRATDAAGNLSPYSPVASATTPAGAATSDNFNRANGPLGANWARPIASEHNLVVANSQVGVDMENSHNYAFWSANSFSDDQYSQATITKIGPWTGVILRADAVQDRFYMAFVFAPNDYRIFARWDGAYYSLATGSTETWQTGDILRAEINGSANPATVTMYRNGHAVLAWTSTDPAQVRVGGSPGVGIYSPGGQGLTLDNWEGGDLAPDTQAPTAPASLTATAASSSQINLSWSASTDNVGVTAYRVERQDPGSTSFAQVGTATGTTYSDAGLSANSSYNYRVRAADAAGNLSSYSPVASANTPAGSAGASDSFNRLDGNLGPNWAKPIASQSDLVITGNQVGVTVENSYNYAFWTANSFGDDQYSQITITKMGSWPGVILRADSLLDRFYLGLLVGPNDYRIYARWDGGYYLLAGGTAATWQVGDTFRMEIKGSTNPMTITLYQNGNAVLSWTSTVPAQVRTGGSPGIGIYSPSGLGLTLDNWAGGGL